MSKTQVCHLVLNQMGSDRVGVEPGYDLVLEESEQAVRPPPMYSVVMLNDDFTPMDFVVHVLEFLFGMPKEKAAQVMFEVHTQGRARCGVFTRDVAETKAAQVIRHARENQHPLLCEIEPILE